MDPWPLSCAADNDADAEVETNKDDLVNELILKLITGHNPAVTLNINGSTFNEIHGNQNIYHGDQNLNIHNYGNSSGNNSVRVDAFARFRLL